MNERGELIPTRRTLLGRLKDCEDQASWKEFFDTYWKLIYTTARKSGLSSAEAEEVVQETVIAVCRNIPKFEYDSAVGSFKTWLLNLTWWRIVDQLRKREPGAHGRRQKADTTRTATIERVPDPAGLNLNWDEEWDRNLLEVAAERVKRQVDPMQYQAFDLYGCQGWTARKVADRLKLNIAQVYLAKHRVSRLIRKELARLEKECRKHDFLNAE
jgi:RNA polymerase sigma factor (sigma-70 family)